MNELTQENFNTLVNLVQDLKTDLAILKRHNLNLMKKVSDHEYFLKDIIKKHADARKEQIDKEMLIAVNRR